MRKASNKNPTAAKLAYFRYGRKAWALCSRVVKGHNLLGDEVCYVTFPNKNGKLRHTRVELPDIRYREIDVIEGLEISLEHGHKPTEFS